MADLGANSLWSKIDSGGDTTNDILGPDYSYSDNIPKPESLGVNSNGSIGQLMTNLGAADEYVKIMLEGDPPLGNQYYVNTGGACTAPDGSTQSRYNYVNNKSSYGLIPGMLGDIEGLNPLYLFKSLTADGTPQCQCYQCSVTSGSPYQFLTPDLSPDFDTSLCTQVDPSLCKKSGSESFSNWRTVNMSYLPTVVALGALLFLTFSGK